MVSEALRMDPPSDMSPKERQRILDEAFKDLVATTFPSTLPTLDSSDVIFVKWEVAPRIHITSAT